MKRLITTIIVFILSAYSLSASQVHLQQYEKIEKDITNVCILKIDKVESEDKYQHFKNGKKKLISNTIIIYGTVKEHLFGNFKVKKIVTKFISIVPIKYSEDGEQEMDFSPILPISGFEHNVEIWKEYIFCESLVGDDVYESARDTDYFSHYFSFYCRSNFCVSHCNFLHFVL